MTALLERIQSANTGIPEKLGEWAAKSTPETLFRVNLKRLSRDIGIPVAELLPLFLRFTHQGIFNLAWEFHCPDCNAIPDFKHNFADVKSQGQCAACNLTFRNTLDKNIEVTFTVHPSVVELPEEIRKNFIADMLEGIRTRSYKMPEVFLSGLECLNNETFREMFGDQVLSTDESLNVETVSFLFTDIKGSTQMYSDLGDTRSYEIVREHFKILFNKIVENGGIIVKTIGDAVMGSFLTPEKALKAAVEAHEEFKKREWANIGMLQIKMGIHAGNAIVVNLNKSVDYFGNTVNTAARIQSSVEDHSIRFSRRVFDDTGVYEFLKSRKAQLRKRVENFKGINDPIETYTFTP